MNERIYLSVFGNPLRKEGAGTLTSGITPFKIEYDGYPGCDVAPYYFVVTVDEKHTIFKLYCNQVMTADGHQGTLIFAMNIPRGYRLQFGKSPYDVLLQAREMFQREYMMPTPGKSEIGNYTYKPIRSVEEAFFTSLINEYPLEKIPLHIVHYPMTGNDIAAVELAADKIRQLFSDFHYPVFVPYKEIVVAETLNTSYYGNRVITGLEIPRKYFFLLSNATNSSMNITVHEEKGEKVLNSVNQYMIEETEFDKKIEISSTEDETYYYRTKVPFIVNELLNGISNSYFQINVAKNQILASVTGTPKRERYEISLTVDGNEIGYELHSQLVNKISLKLNGNPITLNNGKFEIVGEQIKELSNSKFDVCLNDSVYEYENSQLLFGKQLRLGLKKKPSTVTRTIVDSGEDKKKITLTIYIPAVVFKTVFNKNEAEFQIEGENNGLTYKKRIYLSSSEAGKSGLMTTTVELDSKQWKEQPVKVKISGTKNYINSTKKMNNSLVQELLFKNDTKVKSIVPLIRTIKNINLFITPVLLGFCIGLSILLFFTNNDSSQNQAEQKDYKQLLNEAEQKLNEAEQKIDKLESENNELKSKLEKLENKTGTQGEEIKVKEPQKDEDDIVKKALDKNGLSFAEVLTLYQKYKDSNMSPQVKERLEAYNYVSNILQNGTVENVNELMDPKNSAFQQLSDTHTWNVLAIGWGTKDNGEYAINTRNDKNGKKWGNEWFVKYRESNYRTFKSLDAFKNKRNFKIE